MNTIIARPAVYVKHARSRDLRDMWEQGEDFTPLEYLGRGWRGTYFSRRDADALVQMGFTAVILKHSAEDRFEVTENLV